MAKLTKKQKEAARSTVQVGQSEDPTTRELDQEDVSIVRDHQKREERRKY